MGSGFREEREREGGLERVPLGRSAVEKAEKLAEPGQADTAGSRLRRNLIGYVCRRKSSGSIYIYIYMRTCPQSEEKGWFLSFSSSCSQNHDSKSRPSLLRRSRIKLPRTRTGINFALERARVEIPNHWRELRSGSVFGNGAVDRRGGAIIPPWTSPVSVFIKLETLCPQAGITVLCRKYTLDIASRPIKATNNGAGNKRVPAARRVAR